MDWQVLGSIGEFVGGILVVVSLLYLGIQLRQNTRALRAETHQQWVQMNSAQNLLFPQNPEFATIYLKGCKNPEQLTQVERLQFDGLVLNVMNTLEALFFQAHQGAIDDEFLRGREPTLEGLFVIRGVADWWERNAERSLDSRFWSYASEIKARAAV